jgi:hypothetical protein
MGSHRRAGIWEPRRLTPIDSSGIGTAKALSDFGRGSELSPGHWPSSHSRDQGGGRTTGVPGRRASEQKDGGPCRKEESDERRSGHCSRRIPAGALLGRRAVAGDRHLQSRSPGRNAYCATS